MLNPSERALSWTSTTRHGWLVVTDIRLVCTDPAFDHEWVEILGATWDAPKLVVKVWQPTGPRETTLLLPEADVLPQVVRERIMDSLLVQQHVALSGTKGVRFLARRDPRTDAVSWQTVVDSGIDPADPEVAARIAQALTVLRDAYGV